MARAINTSTAYLHGTIKSPTVSELVTQNSCLALTGSAQTQRASFDDPVGNINFN